MGRENYVGVAMFALIKTANKSISRLCNVNCQFSPTPEDELAIKKMKISWVS